MPGPESGPRREPRGSWRWSTTRRRRTTFWRRQSCTFFDVTQRRSKTTSHHKVTTFHVALVKILWKRFSLGKLFNNYFLLRQWRRRRWWWKEERGRSVTLRGLLSKLIPSLQERRAPLNLSLSLFLFLSLSLKQAYVENQPKVPLFLFSDRTETRQKKLESLLELLCRWPLAILWTFVVDFCFSDLPFSECKRLFDFLLLDPSFFLSLSLSLLA